MLEACKAFHLESPLSENEFATHRARVFMRPGVARLMRGVTSAYSPDPCPADVPPCSACLVDDLTAEYHIDRLSYENQTLSLLEALLEEGCSR